MFRSLFLSAFLFVLIGPTVTAAERPRRLVFNDVMLIRDAGSPAQRGHVVVEGVLIAAVGEGSFQPQPRDQVIDGAGRFLSPGLIDMHVHVFDPGDLRLLLAHGVTSARQMSGERKLLDLRQRVAQGKLAGPELIVASPMLNQRSRYASGSAHRFVSGPAHARRLVRRYQGAGYDLIKVYDGLAPDTWRAIIDEAQRRGIPVAGHPPFSIGLEQVLDARMQSVEHAEMIFQAPLDHSSDPARLDALLERIESRGFFFTPTLVVWDDLALLASDRAAFENAYRRDWVNPHLWRQLEPPFAAIAAEPRKQEWLDKSRYLALIAKRIHAHGGRLLIGSDSGYFTNSGAGTVKEMTLLRDAGLAGDQILTFATTNAAAALGRRDIGALAVGMQADMVLTGQDPRAALDTYRDIAGVVSDGRYRDEAAVRRLKAAASSHMGGLPTLFWSAADWFDRWRDSGGQ